MSSLVWRRGLRRWRRSSRLSRSDLRPASHPQSGSAPGQRPSPTHKRPARVLRETNHVKTTLNEREGVELDQASADRGSCKSWSSPVRGSVGQALSRSLVSQSFTMTIPIKCTLSGSSSQHISQSLAGEAKAAPLPIQTHKQTNTTTYRYKSDASSPFSFLTYSTLNANTFLLWSRH